MKKIFYKKKVLALMVSALVSSMTRGAENDYIVDTIESGQDYEVTTTVSGTPYQWVSYLIKPEEGQTGGGLPTFCMTLMW